MNIAEYEMRHEIRREQTPEYRNEYRHENRREQLRENRKNHTNNYVGNYVGNYAGNYVGYDYMELAADSEEISFLIDGYESFGWEVDENALFYETAHGSAPINRVARSGRSGIDKTVVPMKRDRKIVNKTELTRLQRNFEACVRELELLEKSKTSKATTLALIIGFIGTVFMTGAVFAIAAEPPHILLCVLLAIPAFIGWIVPYPLYRRIARQETARVTALIEQKYDEIHAICERGSKLLY